MNRQSALKSILCFVFFLPLFFYLTEPKTTQASPSTELKNQLSLAQLSYFARLGTGNTAGNSFIYVNNTGTTLSINNYNLDIGDSLSIQNSVSGTNVYVVKGMIDGNGIALNTAIGISNVAPGLSVIVPRYSIHTISFKPWSSYQDGKWQVLIKANGTAGTNTNDNSPDPSGFDQGNLLATAVTCPWGAATATGIGTTIVVSGSPYHVITCPLPAGGTNPLGGTGSTGTIVIGNATNMLLNPAPAPNHVIGQANASADTYNFILRHLDASSNVIDEDTTSGKIAVTESVRITATVDPTITFSVGTSGVTTPSTSLCGTAIGNGASNTTAASLDFGSLNLSAFNNLAQFVQCTTNASNGYAIQTFESGQLTMLGGSTTIPDTRCDGSCNATTATAWTTNTSSGFGYSLQVGTTSAGATLGITTSGQYKSFGVGYANAQTILSRTNVPAGTDSAYICYRITVANAQPAGTYQNEVNFIATATF
ncbi:MAG: hypothetical protein KIH89_003300 [Candidatus Shapirobacteria bacterium]|nr:hypothetical protein [Candidatus Shapirobacteria bacterium]